MRAWPRAAGGIDFIRAPCVDTGGHHTQRSYDFCGPRFRRMTPDGGRAFVFAIKGSAGPGHIWPRQASKITTKVPLWLIRVDAGKEQIYGRLAIAEPGAGYIHLPMTVGREFLQGLTAEKLETTVNKKGFAVRTWKKKKPGIRNEPLDTSVYAYAALCGVRAVGFDLEREVQKLGAAPVVMGTPVQAPATPAASPAVPRAPRSPAGWLGETRGWLRR
jgi:phage terminase large subunit GpA-like protein